MSDFPRPVNRKLASLKTYVPGKPMEEVKRELGLNKVIKLASNESAYGPSPEVLKTIRQSAASVARYPDGGSYYLVQELCRQLKLKADNIVLGNGSDEVITLALRTFAEPGSNIVTSNPTFLVYKIAAQAQGVEAIEVPMKNNRYDLDAIAAKVNAKTRIIYIANPDNPVGTYVTGIEVKRFLKKIPERCIVFFDEAYYEYAVKNSDYPDTLHFVNRRNVLVSRTFSKAYGLGGLRVGYAMGHKSLIGLLHKNREPFNVNLIAQKAALSALKDRDYLKKVVKQTESQKKYLYNSFKSLGVDYIPSATNFILLRLGSDAVKVYKELLAAGIITREMSGWGLKNCIRITIGKASENKMLIASLRRILKKGTDK